MKHTWSEEYVNRKPRPQDWLSARRVEFEKATGVHWSFWRQQGKYVFCPDWQGLTPLIDEGRVVAILDSVRQLTTASRLCVSFLKLHESIAGRYSLKDMIRLCLWLVKEQRLGFVVGRTGEANAVRFSPGLGK